MLDDLGTKIPFERLNGFEPSWVIETSPGNFQAGIILAEPITAEQASQLHKAIVNKGLCDPGASGPATRWVRLPVGINGKPKYNDETGNPFPCKLNTFQPENRYTPEEIVQELNLELTPSASKATSTPVSGATEVFTPKAAENPTVTALKERGLYKNSLGAGKHDITCPWVSEHTDSLDSGTAYFESSPEFPTGGFCCQHSHRDKYHNAELIEFLGVSDIEARHKAVIELVPGELHNIVDGMEKVLACTGNVYQSGGLLTSIKPNPETGGVEISPLTKEALTKTLSSTINFTKYDGRAKKNVRCDVPVRSVGMLYDAQSYTHLPSLEGIARQPYFRADGSLVTEAGYDSNTKYYGSFDADKYSFPDPTEEAAIEALVLVEELLEEFHFVEPADKAAALSAIFTAVTRPSLNLAPLFHVKAPVSGSGKSYLCEVSSEFATPEHSKKISFPATSEEATKSLLAALLPRPPVIEFDDMTTDLIPHGIINRILTAEAVTERVLGVSKTATVGTRTLFLSSGNNVSPVRDLLRRVVTIHLDTRSATPATLSYKESPVEKVRANRELYISAVLLVILAWRAAGSPKANVTNIATYNGSWSDYCRYPLMWLGHPDPATSLIAQVTHDPDAELLGGLMREWFKVFGSKPTTVRKVVEMTEYGNPDLLDALSEFPCVERGSINPSKLGWLLKKNANRIVAGLEFQKAEADGRVAWRVVEVATQ